MKILLLVISMFFATSVYSKEWVYIVAPEKIEILDYKKLKPQSFFLQHYDIKNMINLSFFNSRGAIPPHKGMYTFDYDTPKPGWGIFWIDRNNRCFIDSGTVWSPDVAFRSKSVAAGYPLLIVDKQLTKIKSSSFARRKCPRTAIGILSTGEVLIYVSSRATLYQVQQFMYRRECVQAINFDGGGSTFLYVNKKKIFSSQNRYYPNILTW